MSKSKNYLGIVKFGDSWVPNYLIIAPNKVIATAVLDTTLGNSKLLNKRKVRKIKMKEPIIYTLHPFTEGTPETRWEFDEPKDTKDQDIVNQNESYLDGEEC